MSPRLFPLFNYKVDKVCLATLLVIFAGTHLSTLFRVTVRIFETPVAILKFWWLLAVTGILLFICATVFFFGTFLATTASRRQSSLVVGCLVVPITTFGMFRHRVDHLAGARMATVEVSPAEDVSVGWLKKVLGWVGSKIIECKIFLFTVFRPSFLVSRWLILSLSKIELEILVSLVQIAGFVARLTGLGLLREDR